jgi:hypothetical protein
MKILIITLREKGKEETEITLIATLSLTMLGYRHKVKDYRLMVNNQTFQITYEQHNEIYEFYGNDKKELTLEIEMIR